MVEVTVIQMQLVLILKETTLVPVIVATLVMAIVAKVSAFSSTLREIFVYLISM